ncbi:MAG: dihydropyrimidinase [Anaerolineae bacterium]|nr:dihydropyrimidinase [Anaerolineae bacterium]
MGIVFKGGTIINAAETVKADVLVEGEQIVLIGANLPTKGHQVVDAKGKYLLPGGIDVHTHLALPFGGTTSSDDFETGHRAAAFGGTTTHIDFVIQPKGGTLHDGIATWRKKSQIANIDYGYHLAITDLRDEVMNEIPSLLDEGITSLKLFMAYKNVFQIDDTTLFRAMQTAADNGMIVMVHAENGDVVAELTAKLLAEGKTDPYYHAVSRPSTVEGEATGRAVALAGVANCPLYVVHMTCQEAVEQLRLGREKGFPVMGETCVQYMFITADDLKRPNYEGSKFVCSPPVRTKKDHGILWQALRDHTLQVVSTDHCPFWFEGGVNGRIPGKELGKGNFAAIPNGLPAIEDRMKIMWTFGVGEGHFDANRFVELNCTNPAKIFGMYPKKGTISVGADADIAIWDPKKRETVSAATQHMNTDYNIFEGYKLKGLPVAVWLRGQQIVDGEKYLGHNGYGKYQKRSPHAAVL